MSTGRRLSPEEEADVAAIEARLCKPPRPFDQTKMTPEIRERLEFVADVVEGIAVGYKVGDEELEDYGLVEINDHGPDDLPVTQITDRGLKAIGVGVA